MCDKIDAAMRYFFRRRIPSARDVLVIESGSAETARRAVENIRAIFPDARYHLCTCQPGPPAMDYSSVFRATDYPTGWKKLGLLYSFARRRWKILVILCTGESILWRWKMLAVALMPAKVLIVNEHADFFWLDWDNRRTLRRLLSIRWGVNLEEVFWTVMRAIVFPITILVLICTAVFFYMRRAWRLLRWKLAGPPQPPPFCRETSETRR